MPWFAGMPDDDDLHVSNTHHLLCCLQEGAEQAWFAAAFEAAANTPASNEERVRAAELLAKCDAFDNFMQVRYSSVKRYGAEGSEAMLPFFDQLFRSAAAAGFEGDMTPLMSQPFITSWQMS